MARFSCRVLPTDDDTVEVPDIMRALEPEVVDVLWRAIEPLLPAQSARQPRSTKPVPR